MITALEGRARNMLNWISKGATYEEVLQALEYCFGEELFAAAYRSQLKVRTQKARQSLQDFATAIQQLARRSYPASPEEHLRRKVGKTFVEDIEEYEIKIRLLFGGEKTLSDDLRQTLEVHAVLIAARSQRSNNGASRWTRSPPIQRRGARRSGSWNYKKTDNLLSGLHYGRATADDWYQHRDEKAPRDTREPPKTPERRPSNARETGTRNDQLSGNGRRPAEKGEPRQVH
jgi:hypothetical protein